MFETSSSPWATASKQTVTHYESIMSYHSSSTTQKKSLWISPETKWPAKTSVSPRSSPLGAFPPCETFPAAKSEEKRMFSQARNKGCLPFTWVNRSVHGLGKWYAKFKTGKFRKRVYHCTYQLIYQKTTAKAWCWYQRWLWRNGTRISVCNISSVKTGLPFQMFRCSRKFSRWNDQNLDVFHILTNRIFRNLFVNGKQPIFRSFPSVKLV